MGFHVVMPIHMVMPIHVAMPIHAVIHLHGDAHYCSDDAHLCGDAHQPGRAAILEASAEKFCLKTWDKTGASREENRHKRELTLGYNQG